MKNKIIIVLSATSVLLACSNPGKEKQSTDSDTVVVKQSTSTPSTTTSTTFDIDSIPFSEVEIGTFPFLSFPEGYNFNYKKEVSNADINDLDKEYFAVSGKLYPVEGKSFKVRVDKDSEGDKKFSSLVVEKYYVDKIKALGGVQVNNIAVPKSEIERVGDKELIEKQFGFSIDYNLLDDIKTFVIRKKDKVIWIQLTLMDKEVGKLAILEKVTN